MCKSIKAQKMKRKTKMILEHIEIENHLQLLPWHVRFFDGLGESLLVSSQDAGKEIAVSAFQGRQRQFVGSVVIVYSMLGIDWTDRSKKKELTTVVQAEQTNNTD